MIKRTLFTGAATLAIFISTNSWAAFSTDQVIEATKLAVADFNLSAHAQHFVGFKSWKSGEEAKVKIYFKHDGMNMESDYTCHDHDGEIECHGHEH